MNIDAILPMIGNMGGMGVLAWCMFILHRDAIKAFREELAEERKVWMQQLDSERTDRRSFSAGQHVELIGHLTRMQTDVQRILVIVDKEDICKLVPGVQQINKGC